MRMRPRGRVIQAGDQVGEGGFARAAGSDQRHQLPGVSLEADIIQRNAACLADARSGFFFACGDLVLRRRPR